MINLVFTIGTLKMGGAEIFITNLIRDISKVKYKISLIVLDKKNNTILEEQLQMLGISVYYLNKKEGFRPLTLIKMMKLLKQIKPNIIHGNIGGMIYCLPYLFFFRKTKAVHTCHTYPSIEYGKYKRLVLKYFYLRKKIIPVLITNIYLKEFIKLYKIKVENIIIINNGIDYDKFYYKREFNNDVIRLGHVGRFEVVKNHQLIIDLYFLLKRNNFNVSLRLVGDGSLYNKYKNLLSDEDVFFIKETLDVNQELKKIDYFIFPSFYEGFPLSVIEAMASGAIIITSGVGGIAEIVVDGENGYICDYYLDCYYDVIKGLFSNINKKIEISNNNNMKAKQYSLTTMVEKYESIYSEVIKC